MLTFASKATWFKARDEDMKSARSCRAVLTSPNASWGYAPDDERVKAAVAYWVRRARNAHAFALGRKPVITEFIAADGEVAVTGPLYAA